MSTKVKTNNIKKTQITIDTTLQKVVSKVLENYPIYDTNDAIKFLISVGAKKYLDEIDETEFLTSSTTNLARINSGIDQIKKGKVTKINSINQLDDLIQSGI
jgi:hypothetical protein